MQTLIPLFFLVLRVLTLIPCALTYVIAHVLGDLYSAAKAGWKDGSSR